ncbi:MAG: hypothetical protein JOZ27_03875, partial [Caulobacteraceae bacterium]|nr:hypothetical protein [Caulobacteraceae bacterium]
MSAPPISLDEAEATIAVINECIAEGFAIKARGPGVIGATREAGRRMGMTYAGIAGRLIQIKHSYDLAPDHSLAPDAAAPNPGFSIDDLPWDGEPTADELIDHLTARHAQRRVHAEAAKLRTVRIHTEGPIGLAFFGDPHVDDPGCAWGDLKRDVELCRDTKGMFAVDVGDDSNNWVGRLQRLYANQDVTARQSLKLIEWLMTSLPWLYREKGNHDAWNTEKGDPADFIQRG